MVMAIRPKKRLKLLRRAQKRRDSIRVIRRIKRADQIDGHVVDIGRRWVLFAMATDGSPNGYIALRLRDIKRIEWDPSDRFVRRSLKAQNAWAPPASRKGLDLDHGVKELVESVAAISALVTFHPELDRTDICYIGLPVRWGRRRLRLQEVDPQGRWQPVPEKHRIDMITRVDFDGTYERNLAVVAGTRPPLK